MVKRKSFWCRVYYGQSKPSNYAKRIVIIYRRITWLNTAKQCNNTSGVTGVRFDPIRKKWKAKIGNKELGRFDSFDLALAARQQALAAHAYHPNHGV